MEQVTTVRSKVIPLPMKDVDTDLILPAQFLTSISQEGYGANLFRRLRDQDPAFPLNQPRYQGAAILLADSNFGCGSSREHAVWALLGAGIRVVVAKSFADIFYNNSAKNGLLCITLPDAVVDELHAEAARGDLEISVSLPEQEVELTGRRKVPFEYDPFRKHCLMNGLDDLDYLLSHSDEIAAFRRSHERFFDTRSPNNPRP